MKQEYIKRNVTEEGEQAFIEVSVRLSNGHFESSATSSLGDADGARALVEAWVAAMDSVLKQFANEKGKA